MILKLRDIISILILIVLVTSCSKTTPAGFWTDFHSDLITSKDSDQGPWGGHREIHWKSENVNTFSLKEFNAFATKNGWKLTDSISISEGSLIELKDFDYRNGDSSLDILKEEVLPKLKSDDIRVFVFKTGWIAVEPGNAEETEKNGFVTINLSGTEMFVYHLWGE